MARNQKHSRKFHDEIQHYLKHKKMFNSTKLCWDNQKQEYVTTFFFTHISTFIKMKVEVLIG